MLALAVLLLAGLVLPRRHLRRPRRHQDPRNSRFRRRKPVAHARVRACAHPEHALAARYVRPRFLLSLYDLLTSYSGSSSLQDAPDVAFGPARRLVGLRAWALAPARSVCTPSPVVLLRPNLRPPSRHSQRSRRPRKTPQNTRKPSSIARRLAGTDACANSVRLRPLVRPSFFVLTPCRFTDLFNGLGGLESPRRHAQAEHKSSMPRKHGRLRRLGTSAPPHTLSFFMLTSYRFADTLNIFGGLQSTRELCTPSTSARCVRAYARRARTASDTFPVHAHPPPTPPSKLPGFLRRSRRPQEPPASQAWSPTAPYAPVLRLGPRAPGAASMHVRLPSATLSPFPASVRAPRSSRTRSIGAWRPLVRVHTSLGPAARSGAGSAQVRLFMVGSMPASAVCMCTLDSCQVGTCFGTVCVFIFYFLFFYFFI